jgi:hypothetical protein
MSEIEHDQLVEKVNAALEALGKKHPDEITAAAASHRARRLAILIRRYVGGERTEQLFQTMKTETAEEI